MEIKLLVIAEKQFQSSFLRNRSVTTLQISILSLIQQHKSCIMNASMLAALFSRQKQNIIRITTEKNIICNYLSNIKIIVLISKLSTMSRALTWVFIFICKYMYMTLFVYTHTQTKTKLKTPLQIAVAFTVKATTQWNALLDDMSICNSALYC